MRVKHVVQGEFGEVRLPVSGNCPLIEVIDEDARTHALDSAKWRLAEHTKESRFRSFETSLVFLGVRNLIVFSSS